MTRLLSLVLFLFLSLSMSAAFAGDHAAHGDKGAEDAAAIQMCMHCMHTALSCETCGPKMMCDACKDHMATCEHCSNGKHEACPMMQQMMETPCQACIAGMMATVPCAATAKAYVSCRECASFMYLCETHKGEVAACEGCHEGPNMCQAHLGAMFGCDTCMSRIVCPDHLKMMRACAKCAAGEDCEDCMNSSLACADCIALHMPPAPEDSADASATVDGGNNAGTGSSN